MKCLDEIHVGPVVGSLGVGECREAEGNSIHKIGEHYTQIAKR